MNLAVLANIWDCLYFNDWKAGIAKQIDMDFEIVWYEHECINRILRQELDNYDAILFLDIDDIPQPALTAAAKRYAKEYDVTGFGMKLIGEMSGLFGRQCVRVNYTGDGSRNRTITEQDKTYYYSHGFGNTVYRTSILKELVPLTTDLDTIIRAYELGASVYFESLPLIHYRQYGQNDSLVELDGRYVWKA